MNASTNGGGTWQGSGPRGGAGDLEREGDELRADMDRTLDQIERELSPRKLLDRSMEFFQEHGSDFVREAGDTIRRNPMPVLLTAAGVVWLTAAVASSRSSSNQRQRWSGGGGSHLDEDMASFEDFSAGHGYAQSDQSSGQSTHHWREKSKQVGAQVGSQARQVGSQVGSQLERLVREQPIALGALALAAGALLGAALPMTEYENRAMGPLRNRSSWRDRDQGGRNDPGRNDQGRNEENRESSLSSAGRSENDAAMVDE